MTANQERLVQCCRAKSGECTRIGCLHFEPHVPCGIGRHACNVLPLTCPYQSELMVRCDYVEDGE